MRQAESRHILARLAAMLDRPVKSMLVGTKACQEYRLRAVRSGGALLAIPLRGSKRIHLGSSVREVCLGSALLVCKDCRFDNENIPDPSSGDFLVAVLVLPDTVLRAAQGLLDQIPAGGSEPLDIVSLDDISGPLQN